MTALKTKKLSLINEGQGSNYIMFTEQMNVACIKYLMYCDEKSSLQSISNIHLLTNLERFHFNKTAGFNLAYVNFPQFQKLEEVTIETSNIIETLKELQSIQPLKAFNRTQLPSGTRAFGPRIQKLTIQGNSNLTQNPSSLSEPKEDLKHSLAKMKELASGLRSS